MFSESVMSGLRARHLDSCASASSRTNAPDRDDEAEVLGQRHELAGVEQAAGGVLPAHERLDPRHHVDPVQDQVGLVVDAQLAMLDRVADLGLELDPLVGPLTRLLVEQLEARTSPVLGSVHRGVRLPDDRVGRHRGVVDQRDADADRRGQRRAVHLDRLAGGLGDAVGDEHHLALGCEPLEQEREFVAAEARHRVHRAQQRAQPFPQGGEHAIAGGVAARVVDLLEVVEVEEQHGERVAGPAGALQGEVQAVQEQGAVGQAGELVVQRLMGEPRLAALALDGPDQRAPELHGLELGHDQAILGALPHRPQRQVLVVVGAEQHDRRVGGRHPHVLEQRQRIGVRGVRVRGVRGVRAGRERGVEQHAATGMVEQGLGGGRVEGGVRDQVDVVPGGAEHPVDQSRRAVVVGQQQGPHRSSVNALALALAQHGAPFNEQ